MGKTKPRLLLVDDGDNYAESILAHMPEFDLLQPDEANGIRCAPDGPAALAYLAKHAARVDVVLLDMHFDVPGDRLYPLDEGASPRRTRRFQGVAILREIRAAHPHLPVVLLTALDDLSLVDAAADLTSQSMTYVLDGDDLDTLRVRIHSAMEEALQSDEETRVLWGEDPAMKTIRRRLSVLSRGGMPVILEGETGTGKSYLAERYVHANSGRMGPFVVLDLSTVPSNLIPAHLFGAEKGSYTGATESRKGVFEVANGGTVFIDEIQNAPLEVQKQLLLVLQDKRVRPLGASREIQVDVKVIAASNTPLDEAVASGAFRPDLYMRLSPATRVRIPPLRERTGDLEFLARRFAAKALAEPDTGSLRDEVATGLGLAAGAPVVLVVGRKKQGDAGALEIRIPKPAWDMLAAHPWPGNIRELDMLMHNLITFTLVDTLDAIRSNVSFSSKRLQVDPGLVGKLLSGAQSLGRELGMDGGEDDEGIRVAVRPARTLNEVSKEVERQYFLTLYKLCRKDFARMAHHLLGDSSKGRAVRLRFNQLGLKVREIETP